MGRIREIRISGYRSIKDPVKIVFPETGHVVLIGENNAGKSNIVKAIRLLLGPVWPGNYDPEDFEFFGRDRSNTIEISAKFDPPLAGKFEAIIWRYNPLEDIPVYYKGISHGEARYIRNEDREDCIAVVVEAERNLSYHLSYSSKWTLLSRIMRRFHKHLKEHNEVVNNLNGLFEQIKEEFLKISPFKQFVDDLQTEFNDMIDGMQHRLEVDFEAYNPANYFHALKLQAIEGETVVSLEEMGTGEQQILALTLAYSYAKAFHGGILLIIEEPEAHLHPLAQKWLAKKLRSRAQEGLQILITTHSPEFLSIENLEGLVLVYKENGATRTRQLTRKDLSNSLIKLGAPSDKVNEDTVIPYYSVHASPEILSGFFARAIILVEGPTEVFALPELFEKQYFQLEKEGIAIISVGGKGNLAKWYRFFTSYGIPTYIIFDNDITDDKQGIKRKDVLRSVGINDENEIGDLISANDWIVEDKFTIFGKNFENAMRQYFPNYRELEKKAKDEGSTGKPFIAREAVRRLDPDRDHEGWTYIKNMIDKIKHLVKTGTQHEQNKND